MAGTSTSGLYEHAMHVPSTIIRQSGGSQHRAGHVQCLPEAVAEQMQHGVLLPQEVRHEEAPIAATWPVPSRIVNVPGTVQTVAELPLMKILAQLC